MQDYRNSRLDERYRNDSAFHNLVKMFENAIASHGFTPSELREALFLAHYRYEMENPEAIKSLIMIRMAEVYK